MSQDMVDSPRDRMLAQISEVGMALGLDPEFMRDVQARGPAAVIDRAEMLDKTGAQAKLLAMVQRLGMLLQDNALRERQMTDEEIMDSAIYIAQQFGVEPEAALMLLGSVHETAMKVAERLSLPQGETK